MTLGVYNGSALDVSGAAPALAPNASIEVRSETSGALATIYSDADGTAIIVQGGTAYQADSKGRFRFYAPAIEDGYKITVTYNSVSYDLRNVAVGSAQRLDHGVFGAQLLSTDDADEARAALEVYTAEEADALAAGLSGQAAPAVRQTVSYAEVDANGGCALLSAGGGLNVNINAADDDAVLDFAVGALNFRSTLTNDAANQGSLVASNTNFVHATRVDNDSVTWGNCLVPPQYGSAFDRARGMLLNFEGADASTSIIDDFGNTWTASGNAQLDTAQKKFGSSSLLLDGTGDYVTTTDFKSFGFGSWEVKLAFRIAALPASGATKYLFMALNAGNFGVVLRLNNTAGVTKLQLYVSSTGTSFDVANGSLGANTTWALNQWNRVRIVFDALAGTYRVYLSLNYAAETQDINVGSTARVCAVTHARLGADHAGAEGFNGWLDAFVFLQCATKTGIETPSAVAPAITDHPVHFFSIPQMKMYEVTAASVSAGVNPAMTQRTRLFVGEADTGAATVSEVRNYALRGEYNGETDGVAINTSLNIQHNVGVPREFLSVVFLGRSTSNVNLQQWAPLTSSTTTDVGFPAEVYSAVNMVNDRLVVALRAFSGGILISGTGITTSAYRVRTIVRRAF